MTLFSNGGLTEGIFLMKSDFLTCIFINILQIWAELLISTAYGITYLILQKRTYPISTGTVIHEHVILKSRGKAQLRLGNCQNWISERASFELHSYLYLYVQHHKELCAPVHEFIPRWVTH